MTTRESLTSRRGLGGFVALIGGLAMVWSVFIPWLGFPSLGNTATGWDTYALSSGGARWFTLNAFDATGVSPGFAGSVALIGAGLLMLSGLVMLLSLRGGAFRLRRGVAVVLRVLALAAFLVGGTNLVSAYVTAGSGLVTPQWGLFHLGIASLIGVVAVWVGLSRQRS